MKSLKSAIVGGLLAIAFAILMGNASNSQARSFYALGLLVNITNAWVSVWVKDNDQ